MGLSQICMEEDGLLHSVPFYTPGLKRFSRSNAITALLDKLRAMVGVLGSGKEGLLLLVLMAFEVFLMNLN